MIKTLSFLSVAALAVLVICGNCVPQSQEQKLPQAKPLPVRDGPDRFSVVSYGEFNAGYSHNSREILIVTDTKTGVKYLAITGCGTTELREETTTTSAGEFGQVSSTTIEEE